ncbi:energy-coupling factor transporter transmembrane component T [Luteococcus peritonei]|uniref:Energy-coupling factor transporter transmembrane component T n=1 Tax=Luteococcus peritonei TaxID=88874 RepID=A0ABW4RT38_9ACTN
MSRLVGIERELPATAPRVDAGRPQPALDPRDRRPGTRPESAAETRRSAGPRRSLHPWAWWGWALCAATAISLTLNPLMLLLCIGAVVAVVLARRTRAPWARSVRAYLLLAGFILAMRMFFQVVIGRMRSGTVLFTLPSWTAPDWLAGLHFGGPVTLDALLFTLNDTLRLAGILVCVGAANALANPRRALKSVPPALHQISTAVVIALSVAPQLIESGQRVRRARRLRASTSRGRGALRGLLVPVLEDSIERSMQLAASMESRGYGRTLSLQPLGRATATTLLGGMMLMVLGSFAVLGIPGATLLGVAGILVGLGLVVAGLRISGRRLAISHYRPDPWLPAETGAICCGLAAVALSLLLLQLAPGAMTPVTSPPQWPELHPLMPLTALALALPAVLTPAPSKDSL